MKYRQIAKSIPFVGAMFRDAVAKYKEDRIITGISGENVPVYVQREALNNMHKVGNVTSEMKEKISQKLKF